MGEDMILKSCTVSYCESDIIASKRAKVGNKRQAMICLSLTHPYPYWKACFLPGGKFCRKCPDFYFLNLANQILRIHSKTHFICLISYQNTAYSIKDGTS